MFLLAGKPAGNISERETLPRLRGGRYGLSSKSSARAYWRSLMRLAARNPNTVTVVTSVTAAYRKIPTRRRLNGVIYGTGSVSRHEKYSLKLSVILRRGMRKDWLVAA